MKSRFIAPGETVTACDFLNLRQFMVAGPTTALVETDHKSDRRLVASLCIAASAASNKMSFLNRKHRIVMSRKKERKKEKERRRGERPREMFMKYIKAHGRLHTVSLPSVLRRYIFILPVNLLAGSSSCTILPPCRIAPATFTLSRN